MFVDAMYYRKQHIFQTYAHILKQLLCHTSGCPSQINKREIAANIFFHCAMGSVQYILYSFLVFLVPIFEYRLFTSTKGIESILFNRFVVFHKSAYL